MTPTPSATPIGDELVERLRAKRCVNAHGLGTAFPDRLTTEAADAITGLLDRIERLRAELDLAAGRLKWVAEHQPGDRPDVIWRWENEARTALANDGGEGC